MIYCALLWTIPLRSFVGLHAFQSIFYIAFALAVYSMLLSRIKEGTLRFLAIDLALTFFISMSMTNNLVSPSRSIDRVTGEFQNIKNDLPPDSKVYLDGNQTWMVGFSHRAIDYYLVGSWFTTRDEAQYAVSLNPDFPGNKLTTNAHYNLFKLSPAGAAGKGYRSR